MKAKMKDNIQKGEEYFGIVIDNDKKLTQLLQVLDNYKGNIPVIISIKDKKYKTNKKINVCDDLMNELLKYVSKQDIIRFKKV